MELYANAGIPCYWVVNLEDRQIEVYTQPKHAPAHEAGFENQQIYSSGQLIPLVVRGETLGLIPVDSLLPAIAQ